MDVKEIGLATGIIVVGAIAVYAATKAISTAGAPSSQAQSGSPPVLFVPVNGGGTTDTPAASAAPAPSNSSGDAAMASLTNSLQETLAAISAQSNNSFSNNAFALFDKLSNNATPTAHDDASNLAVITQGSINIDGKTASYTFANSPSYNPGNRFIDTTKPGSVSFINPATNTK